MLEREKLARIFNLNKCQSYATLSTSSFYAKIAEGWARWDRGSLGNALDKEVRNSREQTELTKHWKNTQQPVNLLVFSSAVGKHEKNRRAKENERRDNWNDTICTVPLPSFSVSFRLISIWNCQKLFKQVDIFPIWKISQVGKQQFYEMSTETAICEAIFLRILALGWLARMQILRESSRGERKEIC